jgi:meiotically up-regulated gene 157 (Mug157) protein
VAVEGLTRVDSESVDDVLESLEATDAGTGFMHESFHKDNPSVFTREWFSWADAMYLELVLRWFKASR